MTVEVTEPKTWQEKKAAADKNFDQARAILTNQVDDGAGGTRDATAEERNLVKPLMEDARQYKADALALKELEAQAQETALGLATEGKTTEEDKAIKTGQRKGEQGQDRFGTWGEYLEAVYIAQVVPNGNVDPRLTFVKYDDNVIKNRKDLGESVGATGGFLVPTEFQTQLQSVMGESATIRPRATIIPMRRRSIQIPVLDQTDTTAGQPHWFGGMTFAWAEEASSKTQSDPDFRQIELVAHKLIGYTRASDELVDDSAVSLDAFLSGPLGFAGGAVWMEEFAFLQGTGAGQPLGVINAGATITEGRNVANAIGFDDLADMVQDFLPSGRGVWHISQSAMSSLIQLNGPTGNPSYIWQANARDGIPGSILGMPVIWTEKLPALGTAGDIVLGDWTYYLIGDRQSTTIESTKFDRWRFDQTSWRMVHRVDGQPWLSAPLTLQDGTTQVSPFVILSTAAGGS
jgi:HK97 family phage major capsid protein